MKKPAHITIDEILRDQGMVKKKDMLYHVVNIKDISKGPSEYEYVHQEFANNEYKEAVQSLRDFGFQHAIKLVSPLQSTTK